MILGKNGNHATPGTPCIYHMPSGIILFTEDSGNEKEFYVFDPEKTVQIYLEIGDKPGSMSAKLMKGFTAIPLKPLTIRIGKSACMVTDTEDPELIAKCRQVLSGIVLARPGEN